MANLLVTGGAGFIGVNFVYYWLARHPGDRLVVLDALTYAGNAASLEAAAVLPEFRFIHGDINDQDLVEKILVDEHVDTLVHFAAESHVDRSIHGPDEFLTTNVLGTHSLLKAAKSVWLKGSRTVEKHLFHHVSTDEVYGSLGPGDPAFHEQTPYTPNSPYSASKASSDHLVRAYHHTYGLRTTTSNCSNNYGPYQFPEKLIPLVITNILRGLPLPVYGDGLNVRDWLYVDDHCQGIDLVIHSGRPGRVYNIGGLNEWTNIDIVRLLCGLIDDLFQKEPELADRFPDSPCARGETAAGLITFVTDRPGHDRRYAIDASRAEVELGYSPAESFQTGIARTVRWYLDHEDWWQKVMDGSYRDWMARNYESGLFS